MKTTNSGIVGERETKIVGEWLKPKVSLAVSTRSNHVRQSIYQMTKRLLLSCLTLVLATGCLFSKKPAKPKESSAIASEVEESFRKRWTDRRVAELVAQGTAAEAARTQAEGEFRERFEFTQAAKKK